jgi:hypothetical protein
MDSMAGPRADRIEFVPLILAGCTFHKKEPVCQRRSYEKLCAASFDFWGKYSNERTIREEIHSVAPDLAAMTQSERRAPSRPVSNPNRQRAETVLGVPASWIVSNF